MQNLFLYHKYNIRVQLLLKYPAKKINKIVQSVLNKILFEVDMNDLKKTYYIYIYNIALLLRIIANKFLYVKRVNKKYNINRVYFSANIGGSHIYKFLDAFTCLLLPIFESFNVLLDLNKFDIFGNLQYRLIYCDPVFMSKNAVTVWSPAYNVNLKICFKSWDKFLNCNILQYLKFKWYV